VSDRQGSFGQRFHATGEVVIQRPVGHATLDLHDHLPNSEIHPLGAGHFAWEQAPDEYGRLVVDWVSGGYRRVRGG
jgi:pimeloyl-ACP methyl ester carboxylesterase